MISRFILEVLGCDVTVSSVIDQECKARVQTLFVVVQS